MSSVTKTDINDLLERWTNAKQEIVELEAKIEAEKKAIEEKIVKKSLSNKNKEIKKQEILDEISDDETPI
jgi:hypothetical protein